MAKKNLMSVVLENCLEGYTLDQNNKLKVINEDAAKRAQDAISKLVLERSRKWWNMLEAAEDSLAGISDTIAFEELNADPSRMNNAARTGLVRAPDAQANVAGADAGQVAGGSTGGEMAAPTLESVLAPEDFDFDRLFEDFGMHDPRMMDAEGEHMDGDREFDNMKTGHDEHNIGAPMDGDDAELGPDAMGGQEGDGSDLPDDEGMEAGGEDMMGDDDGMMGDDMGGDDMMGDDMGGEDSLDLRFLDRENFGPEGGEGFGGEEGGEGIEGDDQFGDHPMHRKAEEEMGAGMAY